MRGMRLAKRYEATQDNVKDCTHTLEQFVEQLTCIVKSPALEEIYQF